MDEMNSEFYVTLPSNASMKYFPQNTQSSYRTKLISPLILNGTYEVGLSEIFIPRNWFNVGHQNNSYSLTSETETEVVVESKHYDIRFTYDPEKDTKTFFFELNKSIERKIGRNVKFTPYPDGKTVLIEISEGFEVHLSKDRSTKLSYMLHFPNEDTILKETITRNFRRSTQKEAQEFSIVNRNPISTTSHVIPLNPIQGEVDRLRKGSIFAVLSKNTSDLNLNTYVTFNYDALEEELEIRVSDYAELKITKDKAPTFLRILDEAANDLLVKGSRTFSVNPYLMASEGEHFVLNIKEFSKVKKREQTRQQYNLDVGMYKSPGELFSQFREIQLHQLPNSRVVLSVPDSIEVTFGQGLADMLGFDINQFKAGKFISKYPLEMDAGITEIMVYSDLVESHHVGDSYVPLLRIIPCMNEKNEQIVKHYETPIYFPLRKHFVDTIEIELRTASGKPITFTGGKTIACLSFRRKKTIN